MPSDLPAVSLYLCGQSRLWYRRRMTRFEVYPFVRVSPDARKRLLVGALLLTIAVSLVIAQIGAPLSTAATPSGILDLEFARDSASAARVVDAWGENGRVAAVRQTWVDFLYLVCYAVTLALAVGLAVAVWAKRSVLFGWIGVALAWGSLAAAALDGIENIAILTFLGGAGSDDLATLMRVSAIAKFTLIITAFCYALFGAALWIGDRIIAIGKLWYRSVVDAPDQD
jgi:hypothetical protein